MPCSGSFATNYVHPARHKLESDPLRVPVDLHSSCQDISGAQAEGLNSVLQNSSDTGSTHRLARKISRTLSEENAIKAESLEQQVQLESGVLSSLLPPKPGF